MRILSLVKFGYGRRGNSLTFYDINFYIGVRECVCACLHGCVCVCLCVCTYLDFIVLLLFCFILPFYACSTFYPKEKKMKLELYMGGWETIFIDP